MSERLSANAMLIRSWSDGLPNKNRIAIVELFDTVELSRQQCKEEIQSLKAELKESNRRRDIAEDAFRAYSKSASILLAKNKAELKEERECVDETEVDIAVINFNDPAVITNETDREILNTVFNRLRKTKAKRSEG